MQRDESRHDFAFMAGVVVGAIAGALATLALTPMSGPETRAKLRERTGDLGPVVDRATSVAGSAQQLVSSGRERATELAAKAPLSIPGRGSEGSTNGSSDAATQNREQEHESETDRMMAENPSSTPSSSSSSSSSLSGEGASPHSVHPQEPSEGRADVPEETAGNEGGQLSEEETGSGRTPHPSEPAEGRADVPPSKNTPESGSENE